MSLLLAILSVVEVFQYLENYVEDWFSGLFGNNVVIKIIVNLLFAAIIVPVQKGVAVLMKVSEAGIANMRERLKAAEEKGRQEGEEVGYAKGYEDGRHAPKTP